MSDLRGCSALQGSPRTLSQEAGGRSQEQGQEARAASQERREARGKSRSRGLAAIDPKFISQVGKCVNYNKDIVGCLRNSIKLASKVFGFACKDGHSFIGGQPIK